nr:hypothetical protein [Tanacetum cinerariifolium]
MVGLLFRMFSVNRIEDIGTGASSYRVAQNIVRNANLGEGAALDEEHLPFIAGGQDNVVDFDVDEQPVQDLALNVDNVKENQEKDKIGSKLDKNRKCGKAEKSLKQLQLKEEEKLKKTKKEWQKTHTRIKSYATLKKRRKEKGQMCNSSKVQPQGPSLPTA